MASILQQDDMVRLSGLTNASLHTLPSAYSIKRHPLHPTISLSIGSTIIEFLLVGVATTRSKVCNVNEIQVLFWNSDVDFSRLKMKKFVGKKRITYNVTAPKNQRFLERINTVTITYELYDFFLSQGVICEEV